MALSSDHLPVVPEIQMEKEKRKQIIVKVNREKFEKEVTTRKRPIITTEELEEAVLDIEKGITAAISASSYKKDYTKHSAIPQEIKQLIKEKNRTKKEYFRTFNPLVRTHLNHLTNEVQSRLNDYYNEI